MEQAIKYVVIAFLAGTGAWISGYHTGSLDEGAKVYYAAHVKATEYYYRQQKIDAHTNEIIRKANYDRGFSDCQAQF